MLVPPSTHAAVDARRAGMPRAARHAKIVTASVAWGGFPWPARNRVRRAKPDFTRCVRMLRGGGWVANVLAPAAACCVLLSLTPRLPCSTLCAARTFMPLRQPMKGQSSCLLCKAGRYRQRTGAQSEAACLRCATGTVSASGASGCHMTTEALAVRRTKAPQDPAVLTCTAGEYMDQSNPEASCLVCPAGKYSEAEGPRSPTWCRTCGAGRYGLGGSRAARCDGKCPAGRYGAGGSTSAECDGVCPAGRWSRAGATDADCDGVCRAGHFGARGSSGGSPSCDGACPAGRFSDDGAGHCTACVPGRAQRGAGMSDCSDCPAGRLIMSSRG